MLSSKARCETRDRRGITVYWGDLEIDEINSTDDLHNISVGTIATFTTSGCEDKEGVPYNTEIPLNARLTGQRSGIPTGIWRFQGRKKLNNGLYTYKVEKIQ